MKIPANAIENLLAPWDHPNSPGGTVGIVHDGDLVFHHHVGMASIEHRVPIGPDTVFSLGSTAKQVTAFCIALLIESGDLSIDDNVHTFIPELPDYGQAITIGHLIHHTSGLRDVYDCLMLCGLQEGQDTLPWTEIMAMAFRQQTLNFPPGSAFLYSNTGYNLLSIVVERVSGRTLQEYASEMVFTPLGMTHTRYRDDLYGVIENRATAYAPASDGFRLYEPALSMLGAASLYTTLTDLVHWDQLFYTNPIEGGGRLINRLTTPGSLADGTPIRYGYGLYLDSYRGLSTVSHGGQEAGYRAELLRFPEQQFSIICLSNVLNLYAESISRRIADLCLADQMRPMPGYSPNNERNLRIPAGTWWNPDGGTIVEIAYQKDIPNMKAFGYRFTLDQIGPTTWEAVDAPVDITLDLNNRGIHFKVAGDPTELLAPITLAQPDSIVFEDYSGKYVSPELNVSYSIEADNEELYLTRGEGGRQGLHIGPHDTFLHDGIVLRFVRSQHRVITGIRASTNRARNIWFERSIGE